MVILEDMTKQSPAWAQEKHNNSKTKSPSIDMTTHVEAPLHSLLVWTSTNAFPNPCVVLLRGRVALEPHLLAMLEQDRKGLGFAALVSGFVKPSSVLRQPLQSAKDASFEF
jgi:hypothetical protein